MNKTKRHLDELKDEWEREEIIALEEMLEEEWHRRPDPLQLRVANIVAARQYQEGINAAETNLPKL